MAATLRSPPADVGMVPFPPAMIVHGAECAIAEAYASSHPLTALQLIDPPLSMARAPERYPALFTPALPEFDFEAHFPVRVVWTTAELQWQAQHSVPWYEVHRIEHQREEAADESLDRFEWPSLEEGVQDTVHWLEDEAGLYVRVLTPGSVVEATPCDLPDEEPLAGEAAPARVPPGTVPDWFTAGTYAFAPDGSKKRPIVLDESDLQERFIRGTGPGGQAINKLSTNVELIHVPTHTRITCQATRSRAQNREIARRLMSQRLEFMIKQTWAHTASSARSKERHLAPSVWQSKWDKQRKRKQNKKKKQKKKLATS